MSEEFEVRGAHEDVIEHQAHHGVGLAQYVAIFTAILSTIAAIVSYHGATMQNEALLLKNEAVIKQTQAADQWSLYQANSNKAHLMELASVLVKDKDTENYKKELVRYTQQKNQVMKKAEALEMDFKAANDESALFMKNHHQEAQAMMFLQIAISLASITALTRKRWLFGLAGIAAIVGIGSAILAWMM